MAGAYVPHSLDNGIHTTLGVGEGAASSIPGAIFFNRLLFETCEPHEGSNLCKKIDFRKFAMLFELPKRVET